MSRGLSWVPVAMALLAVAEAVHPLVTVLARTWNDSTLLHVTGSGLGTVALAVVLTSLLPPEDRRTRWVVAITVSVIAVYRVVLVSVTGTQLQWGWDEWWMSVPNPLAQLLLAGWAWLDLEPGAPEARHMMVSPRPAKEPLPSSAETPPSREWNRSTTPWPPRDHDDPEGTLIRPPTRS